MGNRIRDGGGKYRIAVMGALLWGACFATYYSHVVLDHGTLFTHLFYIPIGLAAYWWKKRGVIVAFFLVTMLILSHNILRVNIVVPLHDYFRYGMLVIMGLFVATLSQRLSKAMILKKRVKELSCLYRCSELVEQENIPLEGIFHGVIGLVRDAWQYPDIACVRVIVGGEEYKTANFRETSWKESADIVVAGGILRRRIKMRRRILQQDMMAMREI